MNPLTQDRVYEICRNVGFNHMNARIASAIAMCESGTFVNGLPVANADAIGDQDLADDVWGYSYGLFQVRSLRAETGSGSFRDSELLLRPRFNARAARYIKLNQGWNAWSVYQTGQYKAYLQDLFPPAPGTYVVQAGDTLSGIGEKLGIDWNEIARINKLSSPYSLKIGQVLTLP